MTPTIIFAPSNVHEGYYVEVNGQFTGIVVNLFAYKTMPEYTKEVDGKIDNYIKAQCNDNTDKFSSSKIA